MDCSFDNAADLQIAQFCYLFACQRCRSIFARIAPRPGQGFQDISYSRQAGVQFDGNGRGVGFSCRFLNSDVITVFQVKAKLCQDLLC